MSSDSDEPLELRSKQKSTVEGVKEDNNDLLKAGELKGLKTERT